MSKNLILLPTCKVHLYLVQGHLEVWAKYLEWIPILDFMWTINELCVWVPKFVVLPTNHLLFSILYMWVSPASESFDPNHHAGSLPSYFILWVRVSLSWPLSSPSSGRISQHSKLWLTWLSVSPSWYPLPTPGAISMAALEIKKKWTT